MQNSDLLDRIKIATPCSARWEDMTGDDCIRLCELCNLQAYNFARLSRTEAQALIANAEGRRLCARLYRRADGTVITRDCPVGLREVRRRVGRFAGAVFTALLSLCASAMGQTPSARNGEQTIITRSQQEPGLIAGTVIDPNGALVSNVLVTLTSAGMSDRIIVRSNNEGVFRISGLMKGVYELTFAREGFKSYKLTELELREDESVKVSVSLVEAAPSVEMIGVLGVQELLKTPDLNIILSLPKRH
jgi:hypothetical protein